MEHTDLKSMTQQNLPEDQQIVRLFFEAVGKGYHLYQTKIWITLYQCCPEDFIRSERCRRMCK